MTTSPVTLAELFRDDAGRPASLPALSKDRSQDRLDVAVAELPEISRNAVRRAVDEQLDDLLDVEVADILCGGWKKLEALQAYRSPDPAHPDEIAVVPLAAHRMRSTHHPTVEILVDSRPVAKVRFDVVLELEIEVANLKVQHGRIMEILGGAYEATARLGIEGQTLVTRSSRRYELPGRLPLGAGIPIPAL
jgi:hypothetical protein